MKRPSRKLLMFGLVFLLIVGACAAPAVPTPTPPPPTPTPGPLDLVKAFQDTFNLRDTEGFLALFADFPIWDPGGCPQISAVSLKAVRNIAEGYFAINQQIELSDCKLENGIVSCKMTRKDDCVPPELDVFHFDVRFTFKNSKILSVIGQIDSNDNGACESQFVQVPVWAKENLPEDYAKYANDAEWTKVRITGDQGSGKLTATELFQALDRMCTAYVKAKK